MKVDECMCLMGGDMKYHVYNICCRVAARPFDLSAR